MESAREAEAPFGAAPREGKQMEKGGIQLLGALLVQTCSWEASKKELELGLGDVFSWKLY